MEESSGINKPLVDLGLVALRRWTLSRTHVCEHSAIAQNTETTGLEHNTEIVQIAVVAPAGALLLNTLVGDPSKMGAK